MIIINGENKTVVDDATHIDYDEVVRRAGMTGTPTMTYAHGVDGAQGSLCDGQDVAITGAMIFNVSHTGNA